jgi:hypothetical protein
MPALDSLPDKIFEHKILAAEGLFVLEHNPNHNFKAHPHFFQVRAYGKTLFSFFRYDTEGVEEKETDE